MQVIAAVVIIALVQPEFTVSTTSHIIAQKQHLLINIPNIFIFQTRNKKNIIEHYFHLN